jgi:hypothetical protein
MGEAQVKYNKSEKGKATVKRYRDTVKGRASLRASSVAYDSTNKGALTRRRTHLKRKYNITLEEYDAMYTKQDGRCAICDEQYPILCVDHCHATGRVRGLLCPRCNKALGVFNDDIYILSRAIDYLR